MGDSAGTAYAFSVYRVGDIGTSWLYAARGVGAFVGPLIMMSLIVPTAPRDFVKAIGLAYIMAVAGYALFGISTAPLAGVIGVAMGHFGGASVSAFSRGFVQRETPDALRGRVLAVDGMGTSVVTTVSTLIVGTIATTFTPATGVLSGVAGTAITCALWIVVVSRLTADKPKSELRPQ